MNEPVYVDWACQGLLPVGLHHRLGLHLQGHHHLHANIHFCMVFSGNSRRPAVQSGEPAAVSLGHCNAAAGTARCPS